MPVVFVADCYIACTRSIFIPNPLMVVSVDGSGAVSVSVAADVVHLAASPSWRVASTVPSR